MKFSAVSTISLFSLLPIYRSITACRKAILHRSSQSQNFVARDLVINKLTIHICLLWLTDILMFSITPELYCQTLLEEELGIKSWSQRSQWQNLKSLKQEFVPSFYIPDNEIHLLLWKSSGSYLYLLIFSHSWML